MRLAGALALCALSTACVGMDSVRAAVRTRAAGELRCAPAQLAIVQVEGDASLSGFEVEGCGKRRSYAARCWVSQLEGHCSVVAASGLALTAPVPGAPPY